MIEKLNIVKSMTFEALIASEKVMDFLSLYSFLYLNNSAPSNCVTCMRGYYNQLLKEGDERLKLIMEAKKRTLIPNWEGLRYIRGAFYDSQTITDEQAIKSIEQGFLRESHFKKLPEELKPVIERVKEKIFEAVKNLPEQPTDQKISVKKKGRKPKA